MRKWFMIGGSIIVALFVWLCADIYHSSISAEKVEKGDISILTKQYKLKNVEPISTYYGKKTYYIASGENEKGENVIAWVPEKAKKGDVIVRKKEGIISKERVESIVKQDRNPEEIKSIRLAVSPNGKTPLWEVTYTDDENRLTYYYVTIGSGDFYRRYSLTRG
ncbi:DUF5590 domain-containing protein [Priestia filamentosa]|uniref:cell wall elongation regulator TseB-like domain-containing protein n=1 Tax=Priestia filamentosa TaxID=1402861 RepID=UPI0012FE9803|nr:DUF5590 domain-containing protein [Priestia filamentosa]